MLHFAEVENASALSAAVIAAGSLAAVSIALFARHPAHTDQPLIDFDLVTMLLPIVLLGVSIGAASPPGMHPHMLQGNSAGVHAAQGLTPCCLSLGAARRHAGAACLPGLAAELPAHRAAGLPVMDDDAESAAAACWRGGQARRAAVTRGIPGACLILRGWSLVPALTAGQRMHNPVCSG